MFIQPFFKYCRSSYQIQVVPDGHLIYKLRFFRTLDNVQSIRGDYDVMIAKVSLS